MEEQKASFNLSHGNNTFHVEVKNERYIVSLQNGHKISFGATKKGFDKLIKSIKEGKWDAYIEKYGK